MDRAATESVIKLILAEIRHRLAEGKTLATASIACGEAGNVDKAVEIALGIEQMAYEAGRLLDSASLLNRLSKE